MIGLSRLPDHVIDEVRSRIDIVEIISEHVKLQGSGRRYKGLCPFHNEKTPSFFVDRETQLYYCFGCQSGGNVFNFLTELEKAPFAEVVRQLADRVGIPVEEVEVSPREARRRKEEEACWRANKVAQEFFVRCLFSQMGQAARDYLKRRGLTKETVQRFQLGYAPDDWGRLRDYLRSQGVPESVGIKAGLLSQGRRGAYDRFRGRVMFPITDVRGNVVGFGGRILAGEGAKYINTAETPAFSKGNHLYGLEIAAAEFRPMERVVLVEGYMDVIGLYQRGFGPAVASLGTAFTNNQAQMLKRYTQHVVLAYDADAAGQNATLRGLDILKGSGLSLKVARLPEDEDPDSFVASHGKDAFERLVDGAVPLIEYQLEEALRTVNVQGVEGQIEAVKRLLPVLSGIESPVGREGYVAQMAERIGVSPYALADELAKFEGSNGNDRRDRPGMRANGRSRHNLSRSRYTNTDLPSGSRSGQGERPTAQKASGRSKSSRAIPGASVEAALLAWLLKEPQRIGELNESLGESPFIDERYNKVFEWLAQNTDREDNPESIMAQLTDPDLAKIAGEVLMRAETPVGPFRAYLQRAIDERARWHIQGLEAKIGSLMKDDSISPYEINRLVLVYKKIRERLRHATEQVEAS